MTSQQRIKAARERMGTEAAKAKFIAGLPVTTIPEILEAREELKAYDGKDFLSIYNSKLNGVPGKIQKRLSPKNAEEFKRVFENSFVPLYVGQVQQIGILIEETHDRITKAMADVKEKEKFEEIKENYLRNIDSKFSGVPYNAHVKLVHPVILARQKIDREHHDAHVKVVHPEILARQKIDREHHDALKKFSMACEAADRRLYRSSDTRPVKKPHRRHYPDYYGERLPHPNNFDNYDCAST